MATKDRIFISSGEASGDAYGAALVGEMRRLQPQGLTFEGIGGRRLQDVGVDLVARSDAWGAISILESAKIFPRVLIAYQFVKRRLAQGEPGLLVPIDFGFMNVRLARRAKALGWKVLYFVPPGSWNRERQGRDLPGLTDAIATPFSWSAELLNKAGGNAHWFGHPIRQLMGRGTNVAHREGLAVFPGSRRHEITENLPVIAKAVGRLAVDRVEFGLAPALDSTKFRAQWEILVPGRSEDLFTQGDSPGVFRRARAAIVCSGTATLEGALCACPMVVMYRFGELAEFEAKLVGFKRPKFIALPNIVLDRLAVPELVQEDANPESVAHEAEKLLADGPARDAQLASFNELTHQLGPDDAITQTARLALSL